MNLAKKYPVVTSDRIIKEVCDEIGIPVTTGREIYDGWKSLIYNIAQETSQSTIFFNYIGKAYYSMKSVVTKRDKEKLREKRKEINYYINDEDLSRCIHNSIPIYKFYGVNRYNKKENKNYSLKELSKIQEKNFLNEHNKEAPTYNIC